MPADPLPAPLAADPAFEPVAPAWNAAPVAAPPGAPSMQRIAGQYLLLAAGLSNMALPPEIAEFYGRKNVPEEPVRHLAAADRPLLAAAGLPAANKQRRWSADGWLLWRDGAGSGPIAPGAASYGASQAGAVIRYRLASSAMRPQAYARATRTLEGERQSELAAGVSLRPLPALPVRVAAEGRLTDTAAGQEVRPAIFAVTELPPARMPLGLRGETYAQAGYVGGNYATGFIDGQARIDGKLAQLGGEGEVRVGAGVWGGAQKGAARLDVGPTTAITFQLGDAQSRLAVDYRFRVAGQAAPRSGPALTFSAGF